MTKDLFVKKCKVEIQSIEESIKILNDILKNKEVENFDNKVINVRLEKAIKTCYISKYEYAESTYTLKYYTQNCTIQNTEYTCLYSEYYRNININFETNEKRFIYENFINAINEKLEQLKNAKKKYLQNIENFDLQIKQIKEFVKNAKNFKDSLNTDFKAILKDELGHF